MRPRIQFQLIYIEPRESQGLQDVIEHLRLGEDEDVVEPKIETVFYADLTATAILTVANMKKGKSWPLVASSGLYWPRDIFILLILLYP